MSNQDQKKITAAAVQEFLSMVDQYPGLDEFAQGQLDPLLAQMLDAQKYMQSTLQVVQRMSARQDAVVATLQKAKEGAVAKPFTTLFQLSSALGKMDFPAMQRVVNMLPDYTRAIAADYQTTDELHQQLWTQITNMVDQIEAARRDQGAAPEKAQKVPTSQAPASGASHTGPEGVQYVYE